jgi:valyl-tRNA synthetase
MSRELSKRYEPHEVEPRRYEAWESSGVFAPSGDGEPFCIVLPPPNVTGALHMGHALDHALQDALVRQRRMAGFNTLWLPGTDHAGIATQNVVERQLAEVGQTRHDLGREAFLHQVWAWKNESGDAISRQMRRLGDSVDWSRQRFTMDEGLSEAVREAFCQLYDEGIIVRGNRITNWCIRCASAISDIEVEHSDVDGELVELRYPLTDGTGEVTITTTRVETMLADTAIAVHPDDDRYTALVGRTVTLPLVGREIPIVADAAVDPSFGSGALKVTPAHDPTDFEIGQRHGLAAPSVIDLDGRMSAEAGRYAGMERDQARKAVFDALLAEGRVGEVTRPFTHPVGHCSRCKTVVEPLITDQWFVRVEPLVGDAIAAVRDGETRFVPARFERDYVQWMENLRDWCISRQLWWGHRIPVWTCANAHEFAARRDPDACPDCGSAALTQDPDVLDTWFSSGLWPWSTLGWPHATTDLKTWYPTSILVTGYDIITFWVSRMMLLGCHLMDEVPFRTVLIHGMVRETGGRGKKMSKSFGNALDPLDLIDRYGADALRLTLLRGATFGSDVAVDEKWIEGDRNFCTKLWNLARFVLMNADTSAELPEQARRTLADRWILARLDEVTASVSSRFEDLDLARAAQELRAFAWDEFADWYVEWSKGRLRADDLDARRDAAAVCEHVLERLLRLLHPFMPFITEELWTTLTGGETIVTAPWPSPTGSADDTSVASILFCQELVGGLRRFKADHDIAPNVRPAAAAVIPDPSRRQIVLDEIERITALSGFGTIELFDASPPAPGVVARLVLDGAVVSVPLEGLLDLDEERARLAKQRAAHVSEIAKLDAKLGNPDFVARAPEDVVETQRERLDTERELLARVDAALADLT